MYDSNHANKYVKEVTEKVMEEEEVDVKEKGIYIKKESKKLSLVGCYSLAIVGTKISTLF